jgi:hypothetical protein
MSSKEAVKATTSSYAELTTKSYSLFVDAIASANQRALDFTKQVWEISTRPYETNTIESALRENLERTNEIVTLSIAELQTNGKKTAELAEKLVEHAAKLQETYTASLKGIVETGVSNLTYVKDTATSQFEDFAKRVEQTEKSVASSMSSN